MTKCIVNRAVLWQKQDDANLSCNRIMQLSGLSPDTTYQLFHREKTPKRIHRVTLYRLAILFKCDVKDLMA